MEWRTVPGFPLYEVSDTGLVRRNPQTPSHLPRPHLAAKPNSTGYLLVVLMRDAKTHTRMVHNIVCEAFHGPKPTPKHEVGFRDDNRANCHPDNVFWRTRKEERAHRRETGSHREGERVVWAKLRAAQIPNIRARLAAGETCATIGADLGVSEGAINGIRIGRNWKHV